MTGLLIFGGTILVLVFVVSRLDSRRLRRGLQPWTEAPVDRDAQRIRDELRSLTSSYSGREVRHTTPRLRRHPAI